MQAKIGGVLAVLTVLAHPVHAQPLPPESQRTVEWYAAHPYERGQVRRICLNDPGHLAATPDCINAKRGDLLATTRHSPFGSRNATDDTSDPDTPQYWTQRPRDRALKLYYCSQMTPAQAERATCSPAQQSFQQEQRSNARR